ncbi:hypothetical protein RIF29_29662 [Crotalaria pallida]|uniref:Uncharacterized protein n=1 Tax=Crotalaria pallida TaxID=3830 RepID=A0AAN9HWF6_CROPI
MGGLSSGSASIHLCAEAPIRFKLRVLHLHLWFHMKDRCVISCGLIQMIAVGGEYLLEVLDIHLDKI